MQKPNIIWIMADDMGYGDLACQNPDSKIPTPNLDHLAEQGMRFTDAHAPSAVCTPTRYGVLTGRYCWRSRLKRGVLVPFDQTLIEPDRLTVPNLLKAHGYRTACVGKWHLGWNWKNTDGTLAEPRSTGEVIDFSQPIGGGPTTVGFDSYFGTSVPNYPPYCYIENDLTVGIPTALKPETMFGNPGVMLEGWDLVKILPGLTTRAVEYIETHADGANGDPFFLYFPLTGPHTPIAPAPEFIGKSQAGRYGDFVHQIDWLVGQVMDALERTGQAENTLLVFTSDNGSPGRDGTDMNGPINSVRRFGHNPSHIYRGIKADIWDGGHRIPFVARWPTTIPAGTTSDEPVCLTDLMATVATVLGVELPNDAGEDSYNILPALCGESLDAPIREAIVHHSAGGMFAIRQGKWKMIQGIGSGGWTKSDDEPEGVAGQLYDMYADPEEQHNLWRESPDVVQRLEGLLEKYKNAERSVP
jgi:arylsulfatase A